MNPRSCLVALLLLASTPSPATALPDLDGFRTHLDQSEDLARRAHHVGAAAMQLQNELTARIYARTLVCDDATSSLLARERLLGHAYRDLLQAWRMEVVALQQERQLPTLSPLVVEADQQRLATLIRDLAHDLELWRTLAAWQDTRVEPWAGVCPASLRPDVGVPPWTDHPPDPGLAVVIGLGPGRLCPAGVPADGAVVVVEGSACYAPPATGPDGTTCDCTPAPVTDGAVLGDGT